MAVSFSQFFSAPQSRFGLARYVLLLFSVASCRASQKPESFNSLWCSFFTFIGTLQLGKCSVLFKQWASLCCANVAVSYGSGLPLNKVLLFVPCLQHSTGRAKARLKARRCTKPLRGSYPRQQIDKDIDEQRIIQTRMLIHGCIKEINTEYF